VESEAICKEQLARREKVQKIFEKKDASPRNNLVLPEPPLAANIEVVNDETSIDAVNFINDIFGVRSNLEGGASSPLYLPPDLEAATAAKPNFRRRLNFDAN
jgi:hypothetical protein